jgi:hypothetical protein
VFSGDKKATATERLVKLDGTVKWFLETPPKNGSGLTDELAFSLRTTLQSLQRLIAWQESSAAHSFWPSGKAHPTFSFLSTNVVENFFSIIRSKFRYPSLLMYATAYHAAYRYLVWRLAPDSGCPQFKAPIGQAYGNVEGIAFSFKSDVRMWSPSEKTAEIKKTLAKNTAGISEHQHQRLTQVALEIAARLRPTRKALTIREATCKKRPGRCNLILCESKGCPRMFTYAGAYQSHKTRCHPELSPPETLVQSADNDYDDNEAVEEEDDVDEANPVTANTAENAWRAAAVDVETTGRSTKARIVQIAARTADGFTFNELVKPPPGTTWEAKAVQLTGISERTVANARPFADVIKDFIAWLERLNCDEILLVGHNSRRFDRHRFAYEFSQLPAVSPRTGERTMPSNWHWADSRDLAHARFPGQSAKLAVVRVFLSGFFFFLALLSHTQPALSAIFDRERTCTRRPLRCECYVERDQVPSLPQGGLCRQDRRRSR